jgi:hypothetical protein
MSKEPTPAEWAAMDAVHDAQDIAIEQARTFLDEWERGDGGNAPTCDAADALRAALARYDTALAEWEQVHTDAVRPKRRRP